MALNNTINKIPNGSNDEVEPSSGGISDRLAFIGQEPQLREFAKADVHTKRVSKLKFLLPTAAIIVILLIIGVTVFHKIADTGVSISGVGLVNGKLVMDNPTLNGLDSNQRPFTLTAKKAIQSVEDPTLIELVSISARLPMEDNIWAQINAGNGNYDTNTKKLDLGGGINIETDNGIIMELKDAYLDLNEGTLQTNREISMRNKQAQINSQSLEIRENGNQIIFETNVKVVIQPAAWKAKQELAGN